MLDQAQPNGAANGTAMLRSSSRRRLAWIAPLALLFLLTGCAPLPTYESLLVLADTAAGAGPSRLKATTPAPRRIPVTYEVAGRKHMGDIYLPGKGKPEAGIVLVPGAVPKGKDDARLVAFATTLARARFAVLAPEIPGFRQMQIGPSDAREVADAFAYLASRTDFAPGGRAGIGAFSYAVGPAVLAALEPDIRERVRFIVGVGGYHDFGRTMRYFTTGYFEQDGEWTYLKPDDYGKLVLVYSSMPYLSSPRDRELLEAMVARKLKDIEADVSDLAADLGAEGRSVYEVVTNADPLRAQALLAALPAPLYADLQALSLHDKDLSRLKARLILVHGRNDNLIPYTESIALAQAVPVSQARLYLINQILGHVDLSLGHVLSWQFLSRELPDIWRMGRALDALLAERGADGG